MSNVRTIDCKHTQNNAFPPMVYAVGVHGNGTAGGLVWSIGLGIIVYKWSASRQNVPDVPIGPQ
jgi:hypothetical protein